MNNIDRHPECYMRTVLGNCDPIGGFCTSVNKSICEALHKVSRPHGKWIFEETDEYKRTYCSVCGASAPFICISEDFYGRRLHGRIRKTKFCPNCGADMRGENK